MAGSSEITAMSRVGRGVVAPIPKDSALRTRVKITSRVGAADNSEVHPKGTAKTRGEIRVRLGASQYPANRIPQGQEQESA
jgi:hypothetical protein